MEELTDSKVTASEPKRLKEQQHHVPSSSAAMQSEAQMCQLGQQMIQWVRDHAVPSTKATYGSAVKQFKEWCATNGHQSFPANEVTVATYLRYLLEDKKLARNTIHGASSAIASEYKMTPFQSPTDSELVKAVKAVVTRETAAAVPKKPLTRELLVRIVADSKKGSWLDKRDDFMIVLLTAAGLRESEEMALQCHGEIEDVWLEEMPVNGVLQTVLFVFVQKAKNDQGRKGYTVVIGRAADERVCPVELFKQWRERRDPEAKYLFHAKGKTGKLGAKTPNARLKARLQRIAIDPTLYGSHSGRRGVMTEAAAQGVAGRLLKKHANWKSDCYFQYIEESLENRLSVAAAMFGTR